MQQISLDKIREYNQTNERISLHDDCLPEGYSYGSDIEDDKLPDPDQTLSETTYDPYDDPDSIFFRLPYNDDLPTVLDTPPETLCKTLRGDIFDEDGWCITDIPEGSQLVAGDVVERQSTEDPLPGYDDGLAFECDDEDEQLPDYEDSGEVLLRGNDSDDYGLDEEIPDHNGRE